MSEEDVRDGLREAVAGEPRLDFDPDALMASARQQVTRRRSLIAAGVATVAVVVVAVAVPVALGRDQGPPVTTSVADQPTSTSFQWPPSGVKPIEYTSEQLRARGEVMRERLQTLVPEVLGNAGEFDFGRFGGEAEDRFYEGQDSINTHVSFSVDGKRYSLYVEVRAPGLSPSPKECGDGEAYCGQVAFVDGGPLMSSVDDLGNETISTVRHFRPSGTVVSFAAYNYDLAAETPPVYLPTIPVTTDQLVALASDPELGL